MSDPRPPDRGDIVWLQFSPQAGTEQAGHRPAIVLSPGMYNRNAGLASICPIRSRAKGYPFEVSLPGGMRTRGVVLSDQIRSLDWRSRASATSRRPLLRSSRRLRAVS